MCYFEPKPGCTDVMLRLINKFEAVELELMNIESTSFVVSQAISDFFFVKISAVAKLKQMFCPLVVWRGRQTNNKPMMPC